MCVCVCEFECASFSLALWNRAAVFGCLHAPNFTIHHHLMHDQHIDVCLCLCFFPDFSLRRNFVRLCTLFVSVNSTFLFTSCHVEYIYICVCRFIIICKNIYSPSCHSNIQRLSGVVVFIFTSNWKCTHQKRKKKTTPNRKSIQMEKTIYMYKW